MSDQRDNRSSCASFAVGFSAWLRNHPALSIADRALILKAVTDTTPGLRVIAGRRLRDDLLRELAKLHSGSISGVAKQIADDLDAYSGSSFARDRENGRPARSDAKRLLQFQILAACDGSALSWRSIVDILEHG